MGTRTVPYMVKTWFGLGREKPQEGFCIVEFVCDTCGYQEDAGCGMYTGLTVNPRWLRINLPNGKSATFCCHECAHKWRENK